jgi:hypothetical protein
MVVCIWWRGKREDLGDFWLESGENPPLVVLGYDYNSAVWGLSFWHLGVCNHATFWGRKCY